MSRQRPLIDTLPNAVGLKYKGLSPLPGTYAHCALQPISAPRLSPLAHFHTSLSLPLSLSLAHLFRSQSLATSCSLSTLCHCAVTFSMPFHISFILRSPSPPCQSVSTYLFPLSPRPIASSRPSPPASSLLCLSPALCIPPRCRTFIRYNIFSPLCSYFSIIQLSFHVLTIAQSLPVLKWIPTSLSS